MPLSQFGSSKQNKEKVMWNSILILLSVFFCKTNACGSVTHIEISYRALYNYEDTYGDVSYDTIARQNQDALEAGSAFPDSFYPNICFSGKYHSVAEDTHWIPFINASINYIQRQYPKPWDEATQKLVTFVMGVLSHQVADVSWHSLGIEQGFLQSMSKIDYHNDYPTAHTAGDLGGDVLNLYQLNLGYSDTTGDWYVPLDDLVKIYREFYGAEVIPRKVIEECTKILYITKVAERLAVKKYFPISAKGSPYLVDELYPYFLGGLEDMTAWTQRVWKHFSFAMERGQKLCNMDYNPIYLRCNDSSSALQLKKTKPGSVKNGFFTNLNFQGAYLEDVLTKRTSRGVVLTAGPKLKEKLQRASLESDFFPMKQQDRKVIRKMDIQNEKGKADKLPKAIYTTNVAYAKLGSAFAVADLDNDGNEDVVIGSPGFYSKSKQQSGMVFVLFGTDDGLNTSVSDIYEAADVLIPGPEDPHSAHSQFGSSVAVFDFDKDGKLDIAVGAPSFGSVNLTYHGRVFVYSPVNRNVYTLRGVVTCKDVYCNLGSTLTTSDVNSDLFNDLIIGSKFAPGKGEQQGMVQFLHASDKYAGKSGLTWTLGGKGNSGDIMHGSQNYSWFGGSVAAKTFEGNSDTFIALGEPGFRKCASSNCSFNVNDTQAVGQVHLMKAQGGRIHQGSIIRGKEEFDMFGSALAIGRPFDDNSDIIAISATGCDVSGHLSHISDLFDQAGSVFLYNLTDPYQYPIATFSGDRRYDRFGAKVLFSDINRDGFDDFIVGSPLRTHDFTGEISRDVQQGRVYVFMGGPNFPRGNATSGCGLFHPVEPCPGEKASVLLGFTENQARFGSEFAVVKCKNKVNVLATAEQSSKDGRLAGAIGLYEF